MLQGFLETLTEAANTSPWLYGVYLAILAIPIVLLIFCAGSSKPVVVGMSSNPYLIRIPMLIFALSHTHIFFVNYFRTSSR
jgi:hypothetical protein